MAQLTGKWTDARACANTLLLALGLVLTIAASAQAAPGWLDPQGLSAPGKDAFNIGAAMDAAGNGIVVWEREHESGATHDIQIATHTPGGGFSPPADLSLNSTDPVVAMAPDGEAVIAWRRFTGGKYRFEIVTRHPGGAFSAPEIVAEAASNESPAGIKLAINEAGAVVVAWSQLDPNSEIFPIPFFIVASVRPPGGAFSTPKRVTPPEPKHADAPPGETPGEKTERYEAEITEWSERRLTSSEADVAIDEAGVAAAIWSYFDGPTILVQTSTKPAAGSFSPPATVSLGGVKSDEPQIGFDAEGEAFAAWRRRQGGEWTIEAATRPPAGPYSLPQTISTTGAVAEIPFVTVTPAGTATVLWRLTQLGEATLQVNGFEPGGSLFGIEGLPLKSSDHPTFPTIAGNRKGDLMVSWSGTSSTVSLIRASVRNAGGAFSPPSGVSDSSNEALHSAVAIDEGGSGIVAWGRPVSGHRLIEAAGFDAVPPSLSEVSIPPSGTVGSPVQFAATPHDDWTIGPASFDFGDGTGAKGNVVVHTYSKPGTYQVIATAQDGAGTVTQSSATTTIVARNNFRIGALKLDRKKGTGRLIVTVPEPGRLVLSGKGVKRASLSISGAGSVKLPVGPSGKGAATLNKAGKLSLRLKIAYSPIGGATNVQHKKVTLVKKPG